MAKKITELKTKVLTKKDASSALTTTARNKNEVSFFIAGIGASAGGLEAFEDMTESRE